MTKLLHVIGFQCRLSPEALPSWSGERIERYLIQPVAAPLSVDAAVWPIVNEAPTLRAVFSDGAEANPNGLRLHRLNPSPIRFHGLTTVLAIAVDERSAEELRAFHRIEQTGTSIPAIEARGFRLMGYDVADRWLYSSLSNCGFSEDEKKSLRGSFGSVLNERGLFSEEGPAERFRQQSDARHAAHAPFFVYGVWMLQAG